MKTHVREVSLSGRSHGKAVACIALAVACLSGNAAIASTGDTSSQRQATTTRSSLLYDLQQNLRIFAVAAQKYTFENTGSDPWNQDLSTAPVDYAPFLLYAGAVSSPSQAATVCGFTPGAGAQVAGLSTPTNITGVVNNLPMANPVSWTAPTRFLPSRWNPAFKGTYCAVVTLNQPAAKEATLVAYYVAPNGTHSSALQIQMAPSAVAFKGSEAVQKVMNTTDWSILWKPEGSSANGGLSANVGSGTSWVTLGGTLQGTENGFTQNMSSAIKVVPSTEP